MLADDALAAVASSGDKERSGEPGDPGDPIDDRGGVSGNGWPLVGADDVVAAPPVAAALARAASTRLTISLLDDEIDDL